MDPTHAITLSCLGREGQRFDAVTALEVVEHVADQPAFVGSLGGLTQDWGSLLVSTLSRTPQVPPILPNACATLRSRSQL